MLKKLRLAKNAGWRAGMSPRQIVKNPDGTRTLVAPECPLQGRLVRYFWGEGFHQGAMQSMSSWLKGRAA